MLAQDRGFWYVNQTYKQLSFTLLKFVFLVLLCGTSWCEKGLRCRS